MGNGYGKSVLAVAITFTQTGFVTITLTVT